MYVYGRSQLGEDWATSGRELGVVAGDLVARALVIYSCRIRHSVKKV